MSQLDPAPIAPADTSLSDAILAVVPDKGQAQAVVDLVQPLLDQKQADLAAKANELAAVQGQLDALAAQDRDAVVAAMTVRERAFDALHAQVDDEYDAANELHNVRSRKLDVLRASGAECPMDLAALDRVK